MDPYQWWWPGMGLMCLLPLLFMLVVAVLARWGPSCMGRRNRFSPRSETPRDVLDRRLVTGEITQEQYDAMKRVLAG